MAATATPAPATPATTTSPPTASATTESTPTGHERSRIPLSGAAPDAIALDGDTAWVLTGEGGTLLEVDLAAGREVRTIEVGFGPTHIGLPLPGVAAVGRFDDSLNGGYCLIVDLETGEMVPVGTDELGSLAAGDAGVVWALEKDDRLVRIDARGAVITGSTTVEVGEDVHVEVRWGAGAAWVGSDGLPLVRVDGEDLAKHETIQVAEGIPFLFQDGLLWGAGPSQLWALDPTTREVTRRISLTGLIEVFAVAIDGEKAWIAARRTGYVGTVLRLDLASGVVEAGLAVDLPAALALDQDRVWVASYSTSELLGFGR